MKTFIFVAGAPGAGKSTVAALLHQRLGTPLFEFAWIPEFRFTGTRRTTYAEDEALAFENLVMVLKNYARHGYRNVIVTDLENRRIDELVDHFEGYDYLLVTLRVLDEDLLRRRVVDVSRSSGYRDWREALVINRQLLARDPFVNEHFIDVSTEIPATQVADTITGLL